MRRREFIVLTAAGLVAVAASGSAQPTGPPRVAFLSIAFGSEEPVFEAFSDELRALGQIEGKTFRFELHVAPDNRSVPAVAEAMVRSEPAVLVALHSGACEALHRLTQTIPIVVVNSGDPLALGWSTSLARPSGNVTGVLNLVAELAGKRLEILHELVPATRRVGVLYESDSPLHAVILANTTAAAQRTEVTIVPFGLAEAGDLTGMLVQIAAARLDGLIVVASPYLGSHRREIIESALAGRLPTMHALAFEAQDGGLAAYGTNTVENFQRAAQYVDRLLGGAKIADLPFDAPRGVTLTMNRRTARAIGLEIPPSLLARADEVIE
jgi:putative ABC transport system substrate-binding protein